MKNLIYLIPLVLLFACGNSATNPDDVSRDSELVQKPVVDEKPENHTEEPSNIEFNMEDLYGAYVGMFEAEVFDSNKKPSWSNKINITIDKIYGNTIEGHSVVAGNDRPFKGEISQSENDKSFKVVAKEPGDDKYDGVFSFSIFPDEKIVFGVWDANDKNLAVTKRKYELDKTEFKYDPNHNLEDWAYADLYGTYNEKTGESELLTEDVGMFNPSTQELKKEDVENMKKGDLEVMRNTIYAKHGYSFKNRKMRYVFNYVNWYVPMNTDIRDQLTDLEKKNIDLMKRYEQHADRYYDSFGR